MSLPVDSWSASLYNKSIYYAYSDAHTRPTLELLQLKEGERLLDIGCGTGEITVKLQELVGEDGVVVGMDASENMLARAKENGVKRMFCGDAHNLALPAEFKGLLGKFDAVFTSATLHWCNKDPAAVVRGVKDMLKPGGRFVGEFCGYMNSVGVLAATHEVLKRRGITLSKTDQWYMPRAEQYAKILESEGFTVIHVSLDPRITTLPGHLKEFLRALVRISYLKSLDDEEAEIAMQEISDICEPDLKDENGNWSIMFVGLRFVAINT